MCHESMRGVMVASAGICPRLASAWHQHCFGVMFCLFFPSIMSIWLLNGPQDRHTLIWHMKHIHSRPLSTCNQSNTPSTTFYPDPTSLPNPILTLLPPSLCFPPLLMDTFHPCWKLVMKWKEEKTGVFQCSSRFISEEKRCFKLPYFEVPGSTEMQN